MTPGNVKVTEASARQTECRHCGQFIFHSSFNEQGEAFCCEGCKRVHGILSDPQWNRYGNLMEQSGKRPPQAHIGEDYRRFLKGLDDREQLAALGRWTGTRHALTLQSPEITCAGCAWLLENILRDMPGVKAFDVDFLHNEVFLEYESAAVTLPEVLTASANFGYRLKPKPVEAPARPVPDRALLYRLAVSGACFSNAMAFSLAGYLDAFRGMPRAWVAGFGALGFALTLPAVAYCAFPFLSGALRALTARRFNIDVTVTIGILLAFSITSLSTYQGLTSDKRIIPNFSDSITGLIFFLLLGRWAVRRFEAGLALRGRWFEGLRPGKVRVRRPAGIALVDAGEVSPGETLELLAGEYAPMDGTLDGGEAWMDTSLLTGESRPAKINQGGSIFAGYLNLKGRAALKVSGSAGTTRIARLGQELEELAGGRRPIPDGTGQVAKYFTLAVALFGLATFFLHLGDGPLKALTASASVFIISCSCALALAVPISRGLALKRAQALGFHFRAQSTLEALRSIRCVLFDKTGTLTFMRRAVVSWDWLDARGGARPRTLTAMGAEDNLETRILHAVQALAKHSLHPVAVSLKRALETLEDDGTQLHSVRELAHFGMVGKVRGAKGVRTVDWEAVEEDEICICRFGAWEESGGPYAELGYAPPMHPSLPPNSAVGPASPKAQPERNADTCVFWNGRLVATVRFTDEIKPDVALLIANLKKRGLAVSLLSGDNREKVAAFAEACGIEEYHAALTPEDKRRLADGYRARYGRCLAVGDGFNDSLLFGAADLAMAVQGGAVDLSTGTDILSTGAHPSDLDRLFRLADSLRKSIKISYWTSGFYNAAAIAVAMQGLVTPLLAAILMPLSSLSLCLVAYLAIPAPKR